MLRKIHSLIVIALIVSLVGSTFVFVPEVYGTSYAGYTEIESLSSTVECDTEYINVRTPEDELQTIYVEGKIHGGAEMLTIALRKCEAGSEKAIRVFVIPDSSGEFSVKINTAEGNKDTPEAIDGKGTVLTGDDCTSTRPGYGAVPELEEGFYRLLITKATDDEWSLSNWWEGPLGGAYGYVWRNAVFVVDEDNDPSLVQFDNVISKGDAVRAGLEKNETTISGFDGAYERYLDPSMADINFVLDDPDLGTLEGMTPSQVEYIAGIADEVTAGASDDYEKLLKIYEYVASGFYYDFYSWETGEEQYCNPYNNLYALNNGGTLPNMEGKKVATVCDGYSATVIALARAEGIPARMVSGVAIGTSDYWGNVTNVTRDTHWWVEAYVDGRWISIDAERASDNAWKRSSAADPGAWTKADTINYSSFDMDPVAMANTYLLNNVLKGSRDRTYFCYEDEVSSLVSMLEYTEGGTSNGTRMNASYDAEDMSTWGPEPGKSMYGDGYGRAYQILWSNYGLQGSADFSNFSALKYLYLSYNKFTEFSSADSPELKELNLYRNPLKTATFMHSGENITVTAENGSFSMKYFAGNSKPLTVYAGEGENGAQYKGIYDEKGNLISSDKEYSFVPSGSSYKVVFDDTASAVPENVKAGNISSTGKPKITWDKVAGATEYKVYRADSSGGTYKYMYTTSNTSYTNSSANAGYKYYYKVTAVCGGSESAKSSAVSVTCDLPQPSNVKVNNAASSGKPKITWNAVAGADKYYVYRATSSGGTYSYLGSTENTYYTNTGAEAGKTYYYKVKAVKTSNENANSAQSSSCYITCDLPQPSNVKVNNVASSGKPKITWNAVAGADKYYVYRATSSGGTYSYLGSTENTYYTNTGAEAGKTYYYKVKAVKTSNENANSAQSSSCYITCDLARPEISVSGTAQKGALVLTWNKVPGATKYEVYRATSRNGTYYKYGTTTSTKYTNSSVTKGKYYYYKVKAVYGSKTAANSAYSNVGYNYVR